MHVVFTVIAFKFSCFIVDFTRFAMMGNFNLFSYFKKTLAALPMQLNTTTYLGAETKLYRLDSMLFHCYSQVHQSKAAKLSWQRRT